MARHGDRGALDTSPGTDTTAPSNDRMHDARIVFDLHILQDDGILDACSCAHHGTGADGDIRAEFGGLVDSRAGVDVDGGYDGSGGRDEFLRLCLEGLLQVESVGGDGRPGGLDLAPEVLGLQDEETVAISQVGEDVLLETEGVASLRLVVIGTDVGEVNIFGRRVRD